MKVYEDGQIQCRVKIEGAYKGEFFIYEDEENTIGSQFIWPENEERVLDADTEEEKARIRAGAFWWEEGNMSCDCNRWGYLPEHLKLLHSGECGHTITLYKVIPIEGEGLPTLELQND